LFQTLQACQRWFLSTILFVFRSNQVPSSDN
jgi:hypothetical protein